MTSIDTDSKAVAIVIWALAGAGWGLHRFQTNRKNRNERLDLKHLGSTVLAYMVAGGTLAAVGDEYTVENLEYYALMVGPHIDTALNQVFDTRSKPQPQPETA